MIAALLALLVVLLTRPKLHVLKEDDATIGIMITLSVCRKMLGLAVGLR